MSDLNDMLRQQIAHAYQNAPAVREVMDGAGVTPDDIQSVDDLAKIPVTAKDVLQQRQQDNPPFGGFLAVPIQSLQRIYLSPGPIYDPHGFGEEMAARSAQESFTAAGFGDDDIVINTFLYHLVPAGLFIDEGLRMTGATVVPMGPGNTDLQVKVLLDLGVTGYVGTPSFLQMIYDKAIEMGLEAGQIPLQKAWFSAEPYTPSQRQLFEEDYGLITSQAYATADLGVIAYEQPSKAGWYVPSNIIVQICDPETGEELPNGEAGEIVVTNFNHAYPLIRFGTGDLSILDEVTENGQSYRKLRGLLGRSGEAIKVRGMFLHPNALKKALAPFDNIKQFQAVVTREGARDRVALELILTDGSVDENAIMEAVKHEARLTLNAIEIVDSIEGSRIVRDTRTFD